MTWLIIISCCCCYLSLARSYGHFMVETQTLVLLKHHNLLWNKNAYFHLVPYNNTLVKQSTFCFMQYIWEILPRAMIHGINTKKPRDARLQTGTVNVSRRMMPTQIRFKGLPGPQRDVGGNLQLLGHCSLCKTRVSTGQKTHAAGSRSVPPTVIYPILLPLFIKSLFKWPATQISARNKQNKFTSW